MNWDDSLDGTRSFRTAIKETFTATHAVLNDAQTGVAIRVAHLVDDVAAIKATIADGGVDINAVAARVAEAIEPSLRSIIAEELRKLVLKSE